MHRMLLFVLITALVAPAVFGGVNELLQAATEGDVPALQAAIAKGESITVFGPAGESVLGIAMERNDPEVVAFVVEHLSTPTASEYLNALPPNATQTLFQKAIFFAANQGDVQLLVRLVELGGRVPDGEKNPEIWLLVARVMGMSGEETLQRDSLEVFDRAIALAPSNDFAVFSKGMQLGRLGQYDESVRCFSQVVRMGVNAAAVWTNRGLSLELGGNIPAAIENYQNSLLLEPDSNPVSTRLEGLFAEPQASPTAATNLAAFHTEESTQLVHWLEDVFLDRVTVSALLERAGPLERLLVEDVTRMEKGLKQLSLFYVVRNFVDGGETLPLARRTFPSNPFVPLQQARMDMELWNANTQLSTLRAVQPVDVCTALSLLVFLYPELQKPLLPEELAMLQDTTAFLHDHLPNQAFPLVLRAQNFLLFGDFDDAQGLEQALADIEEAIDREPSNSDAWITRAYIQAKASLATRPFQRSQAATWAKQARASADEVSRLAGQQPVYFLELGNIFSALNLSSRALDAYAKAFLLFQDSDPHQVAQKQDIVERVHSHFSRKEWFQSRLQQAQDSLSLETVDMQAFADLLFLLLADGLNDQARDLLEQFSQHHPQQGEQVQKAFSPLLPLGNTQ